MKHLYPFLFLLAGTIFIILSFFIPPGANGNLEVEIRKAGFIMPAAHHVYANENALNGQHYLFKARIVNISDRKLEDVVVRYRVPGFIEWTELTKVGEMFKNQTIAVVCYPRFPEEITEKMTESMEKAELQISWGDNEDNLVEEEFSFKILNRNDYLFTSLPSDEIASWSDAHSNDELLACFVTPNDPIVKYYTQIVQEKVLKGEAASVNQDPKDAVRFLMGIYEATRLSHMVYSSTKGLPQTVDDVTSFSQHNRLPREVITGNTGLCLELSLLYSSMLSAAGLDPIIYLVPGHAYPGFRMNGQFYALEATGIGGEGMGNIMSAEEAYQTGQKQLKEFFQQAQSGDPRYTMLDIHALNQRGVTPMALKDDEYLRQKVDEMAKKFDVNESRSPAAVVRNNRSGGNNGSFRSSAGLSFQAPPGWQTTYHPLPHMPIVSSVTYAPDQSANVAIYEVPATSVNEAMNIIGQYMSSMGTQLQYNLSGNALSGQSISQNGVWVWKGKALQTNSGVQIVAVGAHQMVYAQKEQIINSIYNSIQ